MMRTLPKHGRRLFLRGLGGAAVAAPFLSSLSERAARGQGTALEAPRRLIVMFTPHGCLTDRWFPKNSHGPLVADDLVGSSLEPLAPHTKKLLLPRGIRAMNEWTTDMSLGQGNDRDLQVVGSYFTCVPVTPHSDDPFDFDTQKRFNAMPIAASLDHVCAQQLSADGEPLFLRVSGQSESPATAISYSASETPYAGVGSLATAFGALSGVLGSGEPVVDSYQVLRRQSIIDMVRMDLEALERFDLSAADRQKLAAWKELLHETGNAVAAALCSEELASALGLVEANLDVPTEQGADRLTTQVTSDLDVADLFSNLAVLTALCDQNRVIFLKYPANYTYTGLGLTSESHGIANRTGSANLNGTCLTNVNEKIQTIDRYYAEKFTHLVWQLDQIEEGDGTLLDHTAAVWFQQFSDGAAANLNNLPILQAGSCGGYFKTGVSVNVDDGSSTLTQGNSSMACEPDNQVPVDSKVAGTPVELANAPINKYYCNLMNAIGVKAGPDGFPAAGGTEAVTHYGMYDDTTDFISGGTNPPKINDPGEFVDLRA